MRRRALIARFALACVCALAAAPALAGEKDRTDPAVVARMSVASLDAMQKFAEDIGLPLPKLAPYIERTSGFLGKDELATDRPIGLLVVAGGRVKDGENEMVALPVNAGAATLEQLAQRGFKPAFKNVATGESGSVRRTDNYLYHTSRGAEILNHAREDHFSGDYKSRGVLASGTLNLAAFRTASPKLFADFSAWVAGEGGADTQPADESLKQMAIGPMLKSLDRVSVTFSKDAAGYHLNAWFMPVELPAMRVYPRPALPADAAVSWHAAYPSRQVAEWSLAAASSRNLATYDTRDGQRYTPEQAKKFQANQVRMNRVLFAADAQSGAASLRDGVPYIVLVNRFEKDGDYAAELAASIKEYLALTREFGKEKREWTAEQIKTPAGRTATQIKIEPLTVLFTQSGRTLILTFGKTSPTDIDKLADAPAVGVIDSLLDLQLRPQAFERLWNFASPPAESQPALDKEEPLTLRVQASPANKCIYADLSLTRGSLLTVGKGLHTTINSLLEFSDAASRPASSSQPQTAP